MKKQLQAGLVSALMASSVMMSGAARADQVFAQDVIIQGSLCVGVDCVNGEAFSFDTIILKENNLRIYFNDTSASSAFPNVDWRLIANETNNGGANMFAIEDSTNSKKPFYIEANSPNNLVYLDSAGRVGVKTSSPAVDLHVRSGNSPALRLEQDGSAGFSAQTWDVAGNETNFFIRDVTNASRIPFKIIPSAPNNSLFIAADGDVGLGTSTPDGPFQVENGAGTTDDFFVNSDGFIAIGNNDPKQPVHVAGDGSRRRGIRLEQTTAGTKWDINNYETGAAEGAGNFGINLGGVGTQLVITTTGTLRIPALTNCAPGTLQTNAAGDLSC